MNNYSKEIQAQGKILFDYLYVKDVLEKADVILGFGHFDLKIPRQCAELYLKGYAPKIIFTGGVGAGSADFKHPEAIEFLHLVQKEYPQIPESQIITEDKSTNTGENIMFSEALLHSLNPNFTFQRGIRKVIKVSNAYRQRRAYLTCLKLFPDIHFINAPAATSYEEEFNLYKFKNQDLLIHLVGEIDRLISYPARNFIIPVNIPDQVLEAHENIKQFKFKNKA
jgi:uncharacterized SAM-binding protein YcdF (DUF218 family)